MQPCKTEIIESQLLHGGQTDGKVILETEYFLLLCPSFDVQRQDLLAEIARLLQPVIQIADLSNDALTQFLLYGDHNLSNNLNRSILELALRFINETDRFD